MTLSSNHKIKFTQTSLYTYTTGTEYTAVKAAGHIHILRNGNIVRWQPLGGFCNIIVAEKFLNARDYINATDDLIGISTDDFAYVLEAYDFNLVDNNKWVADLNGTTAYLTASETEFILDIQNGVNVNVKTFDNVSDLILELDTYFTGDDIFTSTAISVKRYVAAAINVRDLAKNLVRVKSSNVWAYGMNLRDRKAKAGEVVVQFKGDKGGPGDVYIYYDVPLVVWRKWLSATSKGHYFWMYIRNTYKYSKLTGDKRGKLRNAVNR